MSTELDLLSDYLNGQEVTATEIAVARSILDRAIAAESAGDADRTSMPTRSTTRQHRRPRHRLRVVTGVAAAVAVSVVLAFQVLPPSKTDSPVAAAAQISHLAEYVPTTSPLQAGQWSTYMLQGVLEANIGDAGNTPTPDARASIPIELESWSNSTGGTCTSEQFGTATFASPSNAQAWHAIGLIDTPTNQPATSCAAGAEIDDGADSALAAIDVSALPQDPAALATKLQTGTTGIPSIDRAATGDPPAVAGFVRLTALLVGPVIGDWPGFSQELLKTMALLPGVRALGRTPAHSGKTGLGFSTEQQVTVNARTGAVMSKWSGPTVVLDSETGALLEARNFTIPVLQSAAQDFVGSPTAPVYTEGVGYGISTEWIDPVGPPGVVGQGALPGWIGSFHIVQAVPKAAATQQQLSDVIDPFLGNGNSAALDDNTPPTYDITIMGSQTVENNVVAALTASGLSSSISVEM
jgi:hypothetical protein